MWTPPRYAGHRAAAVRAAAAPAHAERRSPPRTTGGAPPPARLARNRSVARWHRSRERGRRVFPLVPRRSLERRRAAVSGPRFAPRRSMVGGIVTVPPRSTELGELRHRSTLPGEPSPRPGGSCPPRPRRISTPESAARPLHSTNLKTACEHPPRAQRSRELPERPVRAARSAVALRVPAPREGSRGAAHASQVRGRRRAPPPVRSEGARTRQGLHPVRPPDGARGEERDRPPRRRDRWQWPPRPLGRQPWRPRDPGRLAKHTGGLDGAADPQSIGPPRPRARRVRPPAAARVLGSPELAPPRFGREM